MERKHLQFRNCWIQNISKDVPSFRAYGANWQFLLTPAINPVLYKSSGRFKVSLLHHTGQSEKLVHMFQYNITRVHQLQQQDYARRVVFSHCCLRNMSSISGLLHCIVLYEGCVFPVSGFASTQKTRTLGKENRRGSTTWITQRESNSLVYWARQWCVRSILI